uniref:Uncharacterized protein n=1 Tax=Trichuris muris TaxID=70415 RepID=A0A5S6QND5_TRIMR
MDDDNFTVLDEDDAGLFDEIFPMQKTVTGDLAEEVDRTPNCSDESQKIMLEKISVLRFSVDQMRVRLSSSGRLCRADLLGSCLKVEEFSTGNRHQFYESFRVKEMAGRRTTDCNLAERQYPLRVTMKNCEAALSVYVVDAFVNDLEFSVSNDCLTNLVGFVQDEKASYGSSIRVKLNLTAVRLKITDRKLPDPVCILLNSANILQGPWGNDISTVLSELQRKDSELRQLAEENDSLKRQLRAALEKLHL